MRNVFSRDTLLPATYLLYLRYIERAGSIKQARCNFEKKISQLLIKGENYAKIEHVWSIKMKSAKMLRVGSIGTHKSFFAPNFQ